MCLRQSVSYPLRKLKTAFTITGAMEADSDKQIVKLLIALILSYLSICFPGSFEHSTAM